MSPSSESEPLRPLSSRTLWRVPTSTAAVGRVSLRAACLVFATACGNAPAVTSAPFAADTTLLHAMLVAEDARPTTAEALAPLREGLTSPDPHLRAWAVRALGRLERDSLVPVISPALQDSAAHVRSAAAVALAQAVHRGAPQQARAALLQQLEVESDAHVRGALAESLGRLAPEDAVQLRATAERLLGIAPSSSETSAAQHATLMGVARGLFFLIRRPDARSTLPPAVAAELQRLSAFGRAADAAGAGADVDASTLAARRIRRLALAASASAGALLAASLDSALTDPDPWVRREAALAAGALPDRAVVRRLAERALGDEAAVVRYEAVRILGRPAEGSEMCTLIRQAAGDSDGHVALLAIDLLGTRCAASPGVATLLDSVAATLPAGHAASTSWHRAAHALVALGAVDAQLATARLPAFVASANPFVRTYAATAAGRLRDEVTLLALAEDADANVRTAAVQGLAETAGHRADSVFIAQLDEQDSQLVQTAAAALEGSTDTAALPALLAALERITAQSRETLRDARIALLERIAELGSTGTAEPLRTYVRDYDPAIAGRAAELLSRWTGETVHPDPQRLPLHPVPTPAELDELSRVTLSLEMADGGVIELRPLPYVAPTNVARFVRLARQGYYDGLTIHRVAPNFVLQGGSPGANEYAGDGPYTRDEVGGANWRGTAGLSTRGRDTGDAQLYINLIDNVRLDHDYTVWAEVTSGMEVADRVLEGAVIRRVVVR